MKKAVKERLYLFRYNIKFNEQVFIFVFIKRRLLRFFVLKRVYSKIIIVFWLFILVFVLI